MTGGRQLQPRDQLTATLVEFAQGLVERRTVEDVLVALGDHCTAILPVDGVGVLLQATDDLAVATTNSEIGEAAEHLEVELGEGPCVDAVRTGEPVLVPDLGRAEDRYPTFVPRALEAGVHAVHALPLSARSEVVGALDIVHHAPVELTGEQLATAQVLADVAVAYILAVRLHEERTRLAEQLQHALDTRVVIEQAKGILAERHGVSLSEAFDRLRRHARSANRTARSVAGDVVEGRLRP